MEKGGGIYLPKNWCLKLTEAPEHTHTRTWIIISELTNGFGFLKGIFSPCSSKSKTHSTCKAQKQLTWLSNLGEKINSSSAPPKV